MHLVEHRLLPLLVLLTEGLAAVERALTGGVVEVGVLRDADNGRALGDGQVLGVLAEVVLGGRLDAVGARLVERRTRGDVRRDKTFAQFVQKDLGRNAFAVRFAAREKGYARLALVPPAAQSAEHADGVRPVLRLAEDHAVEIDDRVRRDDDVLRRAGPRDV